MKIIKKYSNFISDLVQGRLSALEVLKIVFGFILGAMIIVFLKLNLFSSDIEMSIGKNIPFIMLMVCCYVTFKSVNGFIRREKKHREDRQKYEQYLNDMLRDIFNNTGRYDYRNVPSPAIDPAYRFLGIPINATKTEALSIYIKLVKKYHPDRGGNIEKMKEINVAWDKIKNSFI